MPGPAIALPLIAGAANFVSGLIGNRSRAKEAQKDRDFQERMSSTAWSRGVADMNAAGLNPALAYSQGGASSPGGSTAQQENVGEDAVGSAMAVKIQQEQMKLMKGQRAKVIAESHTARNQSNITEVESQEAMARRRFYFEANGTPTAEMLQLLQQQHAGRLGSSAQQMNLGLSTQYSLAEQRMMSNLFESIGQGGAGAKTFGPLLIALMRAKGGGR